MKKITYILLFFVLLSCNYFEKKKIHLSDDLIAKKLKNIDLSQIDKYPVFANCEDINNDVLAEKECFMTTISDHFSTFLAAQDIVLPQSIQDTLQVRLQIDQKGAISIQEYQIPETVLTAIPNIKSLISESVSELAPIKPAYIKIPGTNDLVQVKTQFMIPIIVSE